MDKQTSVCGLCHWRLFDTRPDYMEQYRLKVQAKCWVCLGILDISFLEETIDKIAQLQSKQQFQSKSFKLNVKIPLAVLIRQKQYQCFVRQNQVQLHPTPHKIQLKNLFKLLIQPLLAIKLSMKQSRFLELFIIHLEINNPQEEQGAFCPFNELIRWTEIQKAKEKNKPPPFSVKKIGEARPLQNRLICSNTVNLIIGLDNKFFYEQVLKRSTPPPPSRCSVKVEFSSRSIYIMGRYVKFSRFLPQTPWQLNGVKPFKSSIQEQIQRQVLLIFFNCIQQAKTKFHSGGRQDIDVRMLGEGRPFVLEICNPRKLITDAIDFKQLEHSINKGSSSVQINGLMETDLGCFDLLKRYEAQKIKVYACVVAFNKAPAPAAIESFNSLKDMVLDQKTPLRVLHRRTLMVRHKVIHRVKLRLVGQKLASILVMASAGTYIKQFVHGDLGRTEPNVGSLLGVEADIFQLDVMSLYQKLDENSLIEFDNM